MKSMRNVKFIFLTLTLFLGVLLYGQQARAVIDAFGVGAITAGTDDLIGATSSLRFSATSSQALSRGDVVQITFPQITQAQDFNIISATATSFTGSTTLYRALGVTGSNLFLNSSFENSTTSWDAYYNGTSVVTTSSTAASIDGGNNAAKLVTDSSGSLVNYLQIPTVTPGSSYTLSFYSRGASGGETARVLLVGSYAPCGSDVYVFKFTTQQWGCVNVVTAAPANSGYWFDSLLTTSYQRFSTSTIIATSSMQIYLAAGNVLGDGSYANQTVLFDAAQFEAGTTVTAYNGGGTTSDTWGVAVNNNVLYGFVSSTLSAGAAFQANVQSIVNAVGPLQALQSEVWQLKIGTPVSANQPWSTLSVTKVNITTSSLALTRAGGAIVSDFNSRITPSSYATSATNVNYTFVFSATSSIPSGGTIGLNFPAGFNLSGATVTTQNINTSSTPAHIASGAIVINNTGSNNKLILTTSNAATAAHDVITVVVGGITNPSTANAYQGFSIYTTKVNGGLLDGSMSGFSDETGYGTMPPVNAVHIGGTNTLHIVVKKQLANGTTQLLSGDELSQMLVGVGCPDKQFFVGNRWLNSSSQVDFSNLLDCNYMIGVPPINGSDQTFYDSFLQPAMKVVPAIGGVEVTSTIYFGVPDATLKFSVTGGVQGSNAFVNAQSSDFESFSPLFTDTNYTQAGFSSTGTGWAQVKVKSGQDWTVSLEGGTKGGTVGNFSSGAIKFWPPTIPSTFVAASTTYNLGSFAYVAASNTLNISLVGAGGSTPVTTACVGVKRSGGGIFMGAQDTICQPNSGNNYQFKVPSGSIIVQVDRPGFGKSLEFPIGITQTTTNKTISVSVPTSYVSVTVQDSSNVAINGAPIFVHNTSGGFGQGTTNSVGTSTIYISPGTYTVDGFAPGFGQLTATTVTVTDSSNPSVTFTVNTAALKTITGTVSLGGTGLAGVKIGARGTGSTSGGNGTETLSDGTYTLRVPAGTYEVGGWSEDSGGLSPQNVDVSSANASGVSWVLNAQGTLRITIQNSSNVSPLFAGAFNASTGRGNGTDSWTTSGNDKFADIKLPSGSYAVHAGSPQIGEIGNTTATVIAGQTVAVTFNAGTTSLVTLSGTVTSTPSGTAVNNVNVWASRLNGPGFYSTQTDSSGNYSLSVPDALSYKVGVRVLGYVSAVGDVTKAVSGNTVQNFTVSPSASTISGQVKNSSDSAVASAWVSATKTINGNNTRTGAPTDANGNYSLDVTDGTWTVYVEGPCYNRTLGTDVIISGNSPTQNLTLTSTNNCTINTPQINGLTAATGGQITKSDMSLDIPANALGTTNSTVSVSVVKANLAVASANATPLSNSVQSITATDGTSSITSLKNSVSLSISYSTADLPVGFNESTLQLGYFDTNTGQWEPVAATVDTTNHKLTASITHFTDYGPILPGVPTAPTSLTATAASATQINLSWTAASTATSYKVYRSLTDSNFTTAITSGVSGVSYNDTTASASTKYYYKVAGVNDSGEGINSDSANATTNAAASAGGGGAVGGGNSNPGPSNVSVLINSGTTNTTTSTVTLILTATGATGMIISEDSNFSSSTWESFKTSRTWVLSSAFGNKAIYVKFRDTYGSLSSIASTRINLLAPGTILPLETPASVLSTPAVTLVTPVAEVSKTVDLSLQNTEAKVALSGTIVASYQPGSSLKFNYNYQNENAKPLKIKIVRTISNEAGKIVGQAKFDRTLKAKENFAGLASWSLPKNWKPGEYAVKVVINDAANKLLGENEFTINLEPLKYKYVVLGEAELADSAIFFEEVSLQKNKQEARLPVVLNAKYGYTNNSGMKQTLKMVRTFMTADGKILATKQGRWVMALGEKFVSPFVQTLAGSLDAGNYKIHITALDWQTKEVVAENSLSFSVGLK